MIRFVVNALNLYFPKASIRTSTENDNFLNLEFPRDVAGCLNNQTTPC